MKTFLKTLLNTLLKARILFLVLLMLLSPHLSWAQGEPDESYDPFTDYSEFDEATDEEADVNFFRNGRFFTLGLVGGPRMFTENMSKAYGGGPTFGLQLTYFFDLRLGFALGLMTEDHSVAFSTTAGTNYTGNVSLTAVNFDLKYFLSSQNVTKGLADLNPYLLGGFSQYYRTYSLSGIEASSRESVMGTDFGLGLEVPLMRRKAFLGIQTTYHYVSFADENKDFINNGSTSEKLTNKINGDLYDFLLILGMNF